MTNSLVAIEHLVYSMLEYSRGHLETLLCPMFNPDTGIYVPSGELMICSCRCHLTDQRLQGKLVQNLSYRTGIRLCCTKAAGTGYSVSGFSSEHIHGARFLPSGLLHRKCKESFPVGSLLR